MRIQLKGNLKQHTYMGKQGPRWILIHERSERAATGYGVHIMYGQAESLSESTEAATGSGDVPSREMNATGTRQLSPVRLVSEVEFQVLTGVVLSSLPCGIGEAGIKVLPAIHGVRDSESGWGLDSCSGDGTAGCVVHSVTS
ncbi:hypothetical protein [Pseudomonas chlororaphis]|uniref:hypothetical protein n=1 Tax=Pseudomonas chlororaphis TaxID=587753 RepID=UPI0039E16C5D